MQFEQQVNKFLRDNRIGVESEVHSSPFPVLHIPEHNFAIHCVALNRELFRVLPPNFFMDMSNDFTKKTVRLIHLWEDTWNRGRDIVESRLLSLAGISERIHARQTKVVRLNKKESGAFMETHHLQGSTSAYYKYGLMKNERLVAVATFGKSRVMHEGPVYYRSYELERYASVAGTSVIGGLSKLLRHFIEEHEPAHLMTYADRDWGEGNSYRKVGFRFEKYTHPIEFWVDPEKLIRMHAAGKDGPEMIKAGYVKVSNAGNSKWILDGEGVRRKG